MPWNKYLIAYFLLFLAIFIILAGVYSGSSTKYKKRIARTLLYIFSPMAALYIGLTSWLFSGIATIKLLNSLSYKLKDLSLNDGIERETWFISFITAISLASPIIVYILRPKSAQIINILLIPVFILIYITGNMTNYYFTTKMFGSRQAAFTVITLVWSSFLLLIILTYMLYLYLHDELSFEFFETLRVDYPNEIQSNSNRA